MKGHQLLKRTVVLTAATMLGINLVFAASDGGNPWTGIRDRIHQRLVHAGITAEQREQVTRIINAPSGCLSGKRW